MSAQDTQFAVTLSTRMFEDKLRRVDRWAGENFSDRSKITGAVLDKFVSMMDEADAWGQAPSDILRKLRFGQD